MNTEKVKNSMWTAHTAYCTSGTDNSTVHWEEDYGNSWTAGPNFVSYFDYHDHSKNTQNRSRKFLNSVSSIVLCIGASFKKTAEELKPLLSWLVYHTSLCKRAGIFLETARWHRSKKDTLICIVVQVRESYWGVRWQGNLLTRQVNS